jgi:undecaprenyl-diphosphatase
MAGEPSLSMFQAIVIGIVEGLTEFLPVSSTAHNELVPQLLGWGDPGAAFSAVIQLGPIVAILAYFGRDIIQYLRGIVRTKTPFGIPSEDTDARIGWFALIGSLPIMVVGLALKDQIEGSFRSLYVVAWAFIIFGVVLFVAERKSRMDRDLKDITLIDSLFIGIGQCFALIPGTSRSGATLSAAFVRNIDRDSATRFSFLLSIPALTAAGLYELYKEVIKPKAYEHIVPFAVGTVVAGITAFLVIHWFLGYIRKHNMNIFIVYRIVVGILILILLQTGVLHAFPVK